MAKKQLTTEQYKEKVEKGKKKRKTFVNLFVKAAAIGVAGVIVYSASSMAYTRVGLASLFQTAVPASAVSNNGGNVSNSDDNSSLWNDGEDTDAPKDESDKKEESTVMTSKTMQFDLFLKAFQGVKKNAKSVTLVKKNAYNYEQHVDAKGNALIESAGKTLMGSLLKESEHNTVYTGADIATYFPPADATSKLTKDDVQDISCKEEGDYYLITIVAKPATDPVKGEKVGAIATILTKESIQDPIKNVPILNTLEPKCDYRATTATAKIEKETGNLVAYEFDLPMYLYMGDYSVGLGFQEWWTAAY